MAQRTAPWIRPLLVAAALSAAVFVPSRAEAKGILLFTHGDGIKDISPLPPEALKEVSDPELHFGYKYSYFGLFWLDLWTWGGEFCLFKGDNYQSISVEDAARLLGKPEKAIKKPFFYSFPPLLLLIVLGIAAVVLFGVLGKNSDAESGGTGTASGDGASSDGSGAPPPTNPADPATT